MEPIAIVGIGCRLPGEAGSTEDIKTPSALWDLLQSKKDSYTDFPADRLNVDAFYHPDQGRPGSFYTRGGCFLKEDPRKFDSTFFGMNPTESATLDPSSRKLLETAYEAFESSGTSLDALSGSSTGCFVGNFNADQQMMQARDTEYHRPYGMVGGDNSLLSNRISYLFNLHGPSLSLNTACSSSMYALHLACSAIRVGDCDAAVVGGSNLLLSPDYQLFSAGLGGVSKTSCCHTFDSTADGYARAEGVCVLFIKTLSKALKDNDPIRAIIRSSAANANGRTGGITHPDPAAQERLIREAYTRGGDLNPRDTYYIECHGTGTPAGDPLEVEAVGRVFAEHKTKDSPLLIGSVKTNVGHSEATSGLTGVIKTVLAIEKGQIPPIRSLDRLNPNVNLRDGRLSVVRDTVDWPQGMFRRASVSSFGYGGANAHVILEELSSSSPLDRRPKNRLIPHGWRRLQGGSSSSSSSEDEHDGSYTPATPMSLDGSNVDPADYLKHGGADKYFLLPFSAHNEQTLRENMTAFRPQAGQHNTADVAYTLGCRRSRLTYRSFLVANRVELEQETLVSNKPLVNKSKQQRTSRVGFIFTGQGAQWPQMGKELMERFPVYLRSIKRMDRALSGLQTPPEWKMEEILSAPSDVSRVYDSGLSLVVVTAVQVALVDLLSDWSILPVASAGHSSGEIGAAYASGSLTSSEAITIAYARGRAVSRSNAHGAMLAVAMSAEAVQPYLSSRQGIVVACQNSPESSTISGDHASIMDLKAALDAENLFARVVATGGRAYHSPHMQLVGESYEQELDQMLQTLDSKDVPALKPKSRFFSSVTHGTEMQRPVQSAYWRKNLESPVLFADALKNMLSNCEVDCLVEIGPHSALRGPVRQTVSSLDAASRPEYLASLVRKEDGVQCLLQTAGLLWSKGHDLNFPAVNTTSRLAADGETIAHGQSNKVVTDLPTYRWQYGELNYPENRFNREWRLRKHPRHDILGSRQPGCNANEPMWRNILKADSLPWFKDHKIGSDVVFPAAGFALMATEAAMQMIELKGLSRFAFEAYRCEELHLTSAIVLPGGSEGIEILFNLRRLRNSDGIYQENEYEFTVTSVVSSPMGDVFEEHAHGKVIAVPSCTGPKVMDATPQGKPLAMNRWYDTFSREGLNYGATFQSHSNVTAKGFSAKSQIQAEPSGFGIRESEYSIHPTTLDASIQLAIMAAHRGRFSELASGFIPVSFKTITIWPGQADAQTKAASAQSSSPIDGKITSQISIASTSGKILVAIEDLQLVKQAINPPLVQESHPFTRLDWKPDISLLSNQDAKHLWASSSQGSRQTTSSLKLLDELVLNQCIHFFEDHRETFQTTPMAPHLQRLHSWMQQQVNLAKVGKLGGGQEALGRSRDERVRFMQQAQLDLMTTNAPETQLMCRMYENLPRIFSGEVTGIEVAVQDEFLSNWYKYMDLFREGGFVLRDLVSLLSFHKPNMSIFEIGGGTGSATREVLRALKGDQLYAGYDSYTFTDIGPSFLSAAQAEFENCRGTKYAPFDMEKPIDQQNFQSEYDLVIASNVIHVTTDIVKTLQNVRRLIKPGGKLALLEIIQPAPFWTMILGTFSDFWKGDLDPSCPRTEGPFITKENWERILPHCGFSGLDLTLNHFTEDGGTAVLLATAVEPPLSISANPSNDAVKLVYRQSQSDHVLRVRNFLRESGYDVELSPLHRTGSLSDCRVISLAEIDGLLFDNCSETEWAGVREILLNSSSLLWVTGGSLLKAGSPRSTAISGFVSAVRAKEPSPRIVTLDLALEGSIDRSTLAQIRDLEKKATTLSSGDDFEFRASNSIIYTSRLVEDETLGQTNEADQLATSEIAFDGSASYLLVDCDDELTQTLSQWMGSRGAKYLMHWSSEEIDLTNEFAVRQAVARISPPLKGIVLAPLNTTNKPLERLTRDEFVRAYRAHVASTLNLHKATLGTNLDFFLTTSSWHTVRGSPLQAANAAFADSFAQLRQTAGLAATSLSLGHMLDIGPDSYDLARQEQLMGVGLYGNSEQELLHFFSGAVRSHGHLLAGIEPAGLLANSARYPLESMHWRNDPRFSHLLQAVKHLQNSSVEQAGLMIGDDDASESLVVRIKKRIAKSLFISEDDIDGQQPIARYGIDSLVAAEIRSWLLGVLNTDVSLLKLLHPTMSVEALAAEVEANGQK